MIKEALTIFEMTEISMVLSLADIYYLEVRDGYFSKTAVELYFNVILIVCALSVGL